MEIKFSNKPSFELIKRYCERVEYFLSAIDVRLKVNVNEVGTLCSSSMNGVLVSQERWWLGDFVITTPHGEFKLDSLPRFGIDESIDDNEIWSDAWFIQNAIYNKFQLPIPNPNNSTESYWSLWKKISK